MLSVLCFVLCVLRFACCGVGGVFFAFCMFVFWAVCCGVGVNV